jgi:hypothetical protein
VIGLAALTSRGNAMRQPVPYAARSSHLGFDEPDCIKS